MIRLVGGSENFVKILVRYLYCCAIYNFDDHKMARFGVSLVDNTS